MKISTITLNCNGFNHQLSSRTFQERVTLAFALYRNKLPLIFALQEVPTGGRKQSCLNYLWRLAQMYGYKMVLPEAAWKTAEHPKSIQSVLLLRDAKEVEILKLDVELVNRYNFVRVLFNQCPNKEYYILGVHVPQTEYFPGRDIENDSYVRFRKYLCHQFFDVLKNAVEELIAEGKRVVLLGDFNKPLSDRAVKDLLDLGMVVASDVKDNTYFCAGNNTELSVDHILISRNIAEEGKVENCYVDKDFVRVHKLSDHAPVSLDIDDSPHKGTRSKKAVLGSAKVAMGVVQVDAESCVEQMSENMAKKIVFTYDEEVKVWTGEAVEQLEGIILEDESLTVLAKRMEAAIEEWMIK